VRIRSEVFVWRVRRVGWFAFLAFATLLITPGTRVIGQRRGETFSQLRDSAAKASEENRLDAAARLYGKALALNPSWTEGWWSLGTILYDENHYSSAARAFARLVALDSKNGTAHLMLGLCQYQLGSFGLSLRNIEAAERLGVRKDEDLVHVFEYHKAMLLLRNGKYEDAIDPLKRLVEEGVRTEDLALALGMSALLMRPQELPSIEKEHRLVVLSVGQAEALHLSKKNDEAKERYSEIAKASPDSPNIHYAFGHFLLSLDEIDEAVAQFQQEIHNQPDHVRARMEIAATDYRKNSAAGIPYAQQVIQLQPKYPFSHYLLGLLYLDTGDTKRALPELQTAARMVPQEPQFQFALGNAFAKAGRKEEAAKARAVFFRLSHKNATSQGSEKPGATTYEDKPALKLDSAASESNNDERPHP
jgi:tetratricopeptide (TPR) repeat protein